MRAGFYVDKSSIILYVPFTPRRKREVEYLKLNIRSQNRNGYRALSFTAPMLVTRFGYFTQ